MLSRKLAVVFLTLAFAGAGFAKDNLAVLPFIGGAAEEGEAIAELFSFSDELNAAFTPIPLANIMRAIGSEGKFQTGMIDPDTIAAIGRQLGAKYVVAGNIVKSGSQNLLIISILAIDDLRQVAGDVQTYMNIREIQGKLPVMAQDIIEATKLDAARLDKLVVTPAQLRGDVDAQVADTLAQILAINFIKSQRYAVYPRTTTLEQIQAEYDRQGGGATAGENVVETGENPRLALSVVARRLDDQNMFNAAIINLESGAQVSGGSVDYQSLEDGVPAMEGLAQRLSRISMSISAPSHLSLAQSLRWLNSNVEEGGDYIITLKNNEAITPRTLSYSGKKVSVTLDGGEVERTISLNANGSLFTVGAGVTLTLGNNITLRGRSGNTASLAQVNGGGTLIMESGSKVRGNTSGGGVFVSGGGAFTLSGGVISENTASTWGGGVYVDSNGAFTMSGGSISGNTATARGGGVRVYGGVFTMSGGVISGNSASTFGGGGVEVDGTFTMSGGTISGNSTSFFGGGVEVLSGVFTMSGGSISGNSAFFFGGGVYVGGSGTFVKQAGGIIYGSDAGSTLKNTATRGDYYGHAVYIDKSPSKKRNSTAGSGGTLDSRLNGSAGGWE